MHAASVRRPGLRRKPTDGAHEIRCNEDASRVRTREDARRRAKTHQDARKRAKTPENAHFICTMIVRPPHDHR